MMKSAFRSPMRNSGQTLVFFGLAIGAICLLCGLAIDSGLLYLAKARLSRAVDGAALAAVGNFHPIETDPNLSADQQSQLEQNQVAIILRDFAVANYTDLTPISSTLSPTSVPYTLPNGSPGSQVTYNFNDGVKDDSSKPNSPYSRYVEVVLTTGAGGQVTSATCNARCPVRTYFIGLAGTFFKHLKVSSTATATRNPRLIMVVVDRSGSMLSVNSKKGTFGGAYGLPDAIVTFLNFFDTSSDYIGLVSFGSNARLEIPLTTNFLVAATNNLYDAYDVTNSCPLPDPEESTDPNYATSGIRRLKFGGSTSADEGIRLGIEQLMANPGFNDPDVTKYLILFTDGAWNTVRTLVAAPGYTNVVNVPGDSANNPTNDYVTLAATTLPAGNSDNPSHTPLPEDYTLPAGYPVPTLSPYSSMTNVIADTGGGYHPSAHANDSWLSVDDDGEDQPVGKTPMEGAPTSVTNTTYLGPSTIHVGGNTYAMNLNIWLQPGSVDYIYDGPDASGNITATYVSNFNKPTNTVIVTVPPGGSSKLVVPGYVIDGTFTDSLDLPYPDDGSSGTAKLACYRADNYFQDYLWVDDLTSDGTAPAGYHSTERQLMFRNYVNLLTGFYISRPDDPLSIPHTREPLDGVDTFFRPLYGLSAYYPASGVYWPFDLAGIDDTYIRHDDGTHLSVGALRDPLSGDPPQARHFQYTISMSSTNAAPNWAGELFYRGTDPTSTDPATGGTYTISGTNSTAVSTQITSVSDWRSGAGSTPGQWLQTFIQNGVIDGILTEDPSHYGTGSTNIINGKVLRPASFIGTLSPSITSDAQCTPGGSDTGGYATDGAGHYYKNAMAYSSRPTHYYNFATSSWQPIRHNHIFDSTGFQNGVVALPLGNWKVQEYAWHARAQGVTIYTVGYGGDVNDAECAVLAQVANATNINFTEGTNNPTTFNPNQPIGQEFHATTTNDIITDFKSIAQAINAALTQ